MTTALPFQTQQPAFARMGDLANFANMSFEQHESYMRSLDTWRTNMAAEEFTFTKGHEKGFEKGLAEGRKEEKLTIAKNLLGMGMTVEQIAQVTGLSTEDINCL